MLEIGSLVDGKYKILSEIGHGGMSVVYMAINEKANKTWAIKEVRRDGVIDFEAVKQGLIVETDLLKKLKHSHLPSIVDVIENEDTFLIVMDYIEGNALSKTLEEYGAQPQEYVIEWAKQLCDVLGYLHSRTPAIIYRDLKPANVMLKPDGNVMLIDFGTAREYKEKNLADTTCLGTIGYAAPEQFGGMGQTDARTDIYCLGATLYHLITGNNPSEPPYEMKPIKEINPALSSGLEKIILKCTQRNPNDRYQSCAELKYDLDNYEKIDDMYIKKQKRKKALFISAIVFSAVFCAAGIILNFMAAQKATDNYEALLEDASKASSYDEKIAYYLEAIGIEDKAGEPEAYKKLIECYKNNNNENKFTSEEYSELVKCIKNNKESLMKNKQNYAEVCFETGKLIWYYYSYDDTGSNSDNQMMRMVAAVDWFSDAFDNSSEDYANRGMAEVYKEIGAFYRDISINTVEGSDKDTYKPFFDNLNDLLERMDGETDIVKIELYEICRSALQQYTTKFLGDGVAYAEQESMYQKVEAGVTELYKSYSLSGSSNITSGTIEEIISKSYGNLSDTLKAIQVAYGIQQNKE